MGSTSALLTSKGTPLPLQELVTLKGHEGPVLAVKYNTDCNYCLSCGRDRSLRLWNPVRGLHISTYNGHGADVRDVVVSSDNARLASCGGDRSVIIWDVASGGILRRFRGHEYEVNSVKYSQNDAVVVTGSYDRTIRVWDCRSHNSMPLQVMSDFVDSVTSVEVAADQIIGASVDGTLCTYDVRMGRLLRDRVGPPITCTALSQDDLCLLVASLDSSLRLLDRASGMLLNRYEGHKNTTIKLSAAFNDTDAVIACGSEDGRVVFWDLVEGKVIHQLQAHPTVVCGLAYHKSKPCMVSSSVDGLIKVWGPEEQTS
eukprot:jgi/Mesvir1/3262/Mv16399-RA.1